MVDYETIRAFPKAELHVHLDTSVRVETVRELSKTYDIDIPEPLEDAMVAPAHCQDLADYLRRVDPQLAVMQTEEGLERIAYELVETWARDGVMYGEVRYGPQLCTREGLAMDDVVEAVARGLHAGADEFGVTVGQILCCLRHEPPALSEAVARLAVRHWERDETLVVGLDLAGDEARYTGAPHRKAFDLALDAGLPRTVHAGEAAGPDSVREALDVLGAMRIGHGVRAAQDPALLEHIRRDGIVLEMCPTSNVQTRAVDSLETHPIDACYNAGVRVTVSTDAHTISDTSVTEEYMKLVKTCDWSEEHLHTTTHYALDAGFMEAGARRRLLRSVPA